MDKIRQPGPQPDHQPASSPDLLALHKNQQGFFVELVKPWENKLKAPEIAIDFDNLAQKRKNLGRSSLDNYKIELDQESLTAACIREFHPTEGKYWRDDPLVATAKLNDFVQMVKNSNQLPPELKAMLSFAALAPDRGLVLAGQINYRGEPDISRCRGLLTLLAASPDNLQPAKELAIRKMVDTHLLRDFAAEIRSMQDKMNHPTSFFSDRAPEEKALIAKQDIQNAARNDLITLLVSGLSGNPSPEYLSYLFNVSDRLTPDKNHPLGATEIMHLLLTGSDYWFDPQAAEKETYFGHNYEYPSEWTQKMTIENLPFLNHDQAKSDLFFNEALTYANRAGNPSEKAVRLLEIPSSLNQGLVVTDNTRIALLEEMADIPQDTIFKDYSTNRIYDLFMPVIEFEAYQLIVSAQNELSFHFKFNLPLIEKTLQSLQTKKTETAQIARKLAKGVDASHVIKQQLDIFSQNEDFSAWQTAAREKVNKILAEITAEKREKPESFDIRSRFYSERGYSYHSWLSNAILEKFTDLKDKTGFHLSASLNRYHEILNQSDKITPENITKAIEAVDQIGIELFQGILIVNEEKHALVLPFQKKQEYSYSNSFTESLYNFKKEDSQKLSQAISGWETLLPDLESQPLFALNVDIGRVKQEFKDAKKAFQEYADSPDKENQSKSALYSLYCPEAEKFLSAVFALKGIAQRRKELNTPITRNGNNLQVVNARNPRLLDALDLFTKPGGITSPAVIPVSMDIIPGTVIALTGPTGGGKTVTMGSIVFALVDAETHVPLASEVNIPGEKLAFPGMTMVGFNRQEERGRSLFMSSIAELAQSSGSKIVAMDEPGVGAPTALRTSLVEADILARLARGDTVLLATHQGLDMAMTFHLLGMENKLKPFIVTPDETHEIIEGIGGSFGLEMLKMQGCSVEFIKICKDFLEAGATNMSAGSLDLTRRELPPATESAFADDRTLESANLSSVLGYFSQRGKGDSDITARLERQCKKALNEDLRPGIDLIESLEKLKLEKLKELLETENSLSALISATQPPLDTAKAREFLKGELNYGQEEVFLKLNNLTRFLSTLNDPTQIPKIDSVLEFLPENVQKEAKAYLQIIRSAAKKIDLSADQEAFAKRFKEGSDHQEKCIQEIEDETELIPGWPEKIKKARAGLANQDYQPVFTLFSDFVNHSPEPFRRFPDDISKIIIESLTASRKKSWESLFPGKKQAKEGINLVEKLSEVSKLLDDNLDQITFASFIAFSTRSDNQEIPFCQPEIVDDTSQMPFPQQFEGGINIPIFMEDRENYVPQNVFCDENGSFLTSDNLPPAGETRRKGPVQTLVFTGVQGGGKSETAREMLQKELLRAVTNRVPAKKARMAKKPSGLVGIMKPRGTNGTQSTFMHEAKTIASVEAQLRPGVMVIYDEPAEGTVKEEKVAIVDTLGYMIAKMGGTFVATNHETEVHDGWNRLDDKSHIPYYPVAYDWTSDKTRKYHLQHGRVGGAESFTIAQEMGMDPKVVKLAKELNQITLELKQWEKQLL